MKTRHQNLSQLNLNACNYHKKKLWKFQNDSSKLKNPLKKLMSHRFSADFSRKNWLWAIELKISQLFLMIIISILVELEQNPVIGFRDRAILIWQYFKFPKKFAYYSAFVLPFCSQHFFLIGTYQKSYLMCLRVSCESYSTIRTFKDGGPTVALSVSELIWLLCPNSL